MAQSIAFAAALVVLFAAICGQTSAAECGKRFHTQQLREGVANWVVGGEKGVRGAYPWLVSFQWKRRSGNQHNCGGTIISPNWIVTAAHCIFGQEGKYPAKFRIVAGEYNLKSEEGSEQSRDVIRIFMHHEYDEDSSRNDIAVLKLSSPLEFNEFVQPACLPAASAKGLYDVGKKGIISGWGSMTPSSGILDHRPKITPDIYQAAEIPIMDFDVCNSAGHLRNMMFPGMFCAGYEAGGVDSCQGDSGGPFVSAAEDGRMTLVGVTSWGIGCAQKRKPGVYAKVQDYVPWIQKMTGIGPE